MVSEYPIRIFLPFKGMGKARGRAAIVSKNKEFGAYANLLGNKNQRIKVYTQKDYRAWTNKVIAYLIKLKLEGFLPDLPNPCRIECFFCNFGSSDQDNLQGAVIDAIVKAKLLPDDCGSIVIAGSGKFVKVKTKKKEKKRVGVAIEIYPQEIEYMDIDNFLGYERYLEKLQPVLKKAS
ncbi:hypothetical protein FD723_39850 (plasmid) [Nostoc sp. C052]|uniref:hypothetical protein n=1 Tax=Nostoc sp. C052 TaxID=2576902 RepID=UPI0015C393C5|nr:hypothetical protein [Nostoc sp. C052]QLE46367.1 hypothetical protein FD723_39850 [Nostoc sp. C052]